MDEDRLDYLDASDIWNCPHSFEFVCPKEWDELSRTDDESIRWCEKCSRQVHLCRTPQEFVRHGNQGHCVATLPEQHHSLINAAFLGEPSAEAVEKLKRDQDACWDWWQQVINSEPEFEYRMIDELRAQYKHHPSTWRDIDPDPEQVE